MWAWCWLSLTSDKTSKHRVAVYEPSSPVICSWVKAAWPYTLDSAGSAAVRHHLWFGCGEGEHAGHELLAVLIFNFGNFFCSDVAGGGGQLRAANSKPYSRMQVKVFCYFHGIFLIKINHTLWFLLWLLLLENKFLCNLSKIKCRKAFKE